MIFFPYRFGHGYSVSLFFARDEDIEAAKNFVDSRFPERTNMQLHNTTIQFQVSKEPPSVIFGHILANKNSLGIQDFAVKHTTLDEVSDDCSECLNNLTLLEIFCWILETFLCPQCIYVFLPTFFIRSEVYQKKKFYKSQPYFFMDST